ncbi:MAG TPA: hypothetical protein VLB47_12490, partial [Solirubrobacteraceae bacterium]|nr:hypothetical protein [Solirubrobacteraceae bacterium]
MDQPTSSRPSRRAALACALAALATAGGGAAAGAQVAGPGPASGGTGYAPPAPAAGAALARPRVAGVVCRTACRGLSLATRGSVLRVEGDALGAVSRVVFVGGPGARDDVVAPATPAGAGAVDVAVPYRARDGRLAALTTDGRRSP